MNNMSSWEAQTRELIVRVEKELKDVMTHVDMLQQRKEALVEALRAYQQMMGTEEVQKAKWLSPSLLKDMSYKEILRLIAQQNNGLLVVRHAIRLMKDVDVFTNPVHADSVVYSTLGRGDDFERVSKGVYKLRGYNGTSMSAIIKSRKGSPLKHAIKKLKKKDPNMTKKQVKNALIHQSFDFQGKNPGQAVHMAWVNLGYAKKEMQQSLLK